MIVKVADNIVSPLGFTSAENYLSVKEGKSMLNRYSNFWDIPEPFVASLINRDLLDDAVGSLRVDDCTVFEKAVILSVSKALMQTNIDAGSDKVLFILSTTKGNVYLLDKDVTGFPKERVLLGVAAQHVANHFGNPNMPIVVSNACVSGVCAQIEAMRNLQSKKYDYVIVAGADIQSPFIITGFQSLKALSPDPCKPFDTNRCGLNLGDAAATIIYADKDEVGDADWVLCNGAIRNDANHISGPSRVGEGGYRALRAILKNVSPDKIAFVNTHGTATSYNDEMESIALERAGLSDVPINALKGFYGHTMGAAGVLETILSMAAIDDNTILGTKGFETLGVTHKLLMTSHNQPTIKTAFVKLLSGFGGCNGALLFSKGGRP